MTAHRPFHLAFPVTDLESTREFWIGLIGCKEGRSAKSWVDLDCYGHQLTAHIASDPDATSPRASGEVDDKSVPIPHFGVVLTMDDWSALADTLRAAGTKFIIEPYIRFKGKPGEQATMFFRDPSGNAVEMKAFADDAMLFGSV